MVDNEFMSIQEKSYDEILIYLVLIFIYLKFMFQIKANLNMRLVTFYHSNDPVVNATSSGFELLFHHIVVHTDLGVTVSYEMDIKYENLL